MKDIKSLYNSAKYEPTAENISAYKEAINDLMENSPYEYVSKAEYIITSSFGANTLISFIEKNGLPIASFNNIMSILESAIKKCKSNDINYDSFKEAYNGLIDFREKYEKCFDMFDYYNEYNNESYIETYYGKNKDDIPNKNIISGMIKSFKELAIPDTLITAHRLSEKANDKLLDFIINEYKENHLICEWVLEVERSLNDIKNNEKLDVLQENSISYIINGIKEREHKLFRESVILGEDYTFECSDEEYENIKNLIFFKEYKLYYLNDVYSEEASIIKDEILNLYRLLSESYYREGDADIVQLLPNDMPKEESTWASNTTDKKNGKAPGYISNNHDMSSWGEEDKPKSSTVDNLDSNDEYDYKDYKRPSADNSSYDDTTSTTDDEEDDEESEVNDKESLKHQAVNNYYYYSYNNSLNKNQNSFNKDNSRHDNHSVKHINSHNTSNGTTVAKEAWQLNIFDDYISEASHGSLKSAFRMAINIKNGHLIKIIFDLKPEDVKQVGDHANREFRNLKRDEDTIKNINKKGSNDFSSKSMVKSIVDMDTKERLDSVTTIGVIGSNSNTTRFKVPKEFQDEKLGEERTTFYMYPVKVREQIVAKMTETPKDAITYKVGEVEPVPSYKATKSVHSISTLYHNQWKKAKGVKSNDVNIEKAVAKIEKEYSVIKPKLNMKDEDVEFYDNLYHRTLKRIKSTIESNKNENINKTINAAMYVKPYNTLQECIYMLTRSISKQIKESYDEEDDYCFQEGLMDKIKNVSNKVMNKIKTFVFRKKNLYNLQMMDKPGFVKPQPNVLFGIDLNKGNSKIENKNEYVESILESGIQSLSKNDIKNIVNKLRSKFNAEIYFTYSGNVNSDTGGMVCIETDRDHIDKLIKGKTILNIPGKITGMDSDKLEKVILVNTKVLSKNLKTSKDVEIAISHEYGHVLTLDQISQQDWIEYTMKNQEMVNLISTLGILMDDDNIFSKFHSEFVYYGYYNLKPEKLANEAGKVDVRELTKIFTGRYPDESKLKDIDFKAFAEWKFPDKLMTILTNSIMNGKDSYEEIPYRVNEAIKMYRAVIKNPEYLKKVIANLEQELARFKPIKEAVGDADNDRPESDHPIKDTLTDIDREISKHQQGMKKKVQDVQNAGRAAAKPFKRMSQWVNNMISNWRDKDETKAKEKLADPHARKNLFHAIGWLIKNGSLLKAGILLNPIFLLISIYRKATAGSREFRLRNEMIGELKTEIEIIDEKIQDADRKQDLKAKYQLMRFKNEMNKKLLRVGGGKQWKKII